MSLPNKLQLVATVTVSIEYADTIDQAFKDQCEEYLRDPNNHEAIETQIFEAYKAGGVRPAMETTSVALVKEALMEGLREIVTPEGERDEEVNLDVSVTIKTVGEEA